MSIMFDEILGSEQASDAAMVCCDGETIPIHHVVTLPHSRALYKAIENEIRVSKSTKHDVDAVVRIGVEVDYQTVWRVLSFMYTGTYSDEDTTKVFPISPYPKPVVIQLEKELPLFRADMDDGLSSLYRNMQRLLIAPSTSASSVLAQACVAFKVYRTATVWGMPRLMAEVSHRFGTLVLRTSQGPDFKHLVHAVYEYFPDKEFTDAVVEECVSNIGPLLANDDFKRHIGQQSQLWFQILEKVVMQQCDLISGPEKQISPGHASQLLLTNTPHNQDSGNNQPLIASLETKITEIEDQLQEQAEVARRRGDLLDQADDEIQDLKEQVAKLSSSDASANVGKLKAHNNQLVERSNVQTSLITHLTNQVNRSSSSSRENNTQVFLKQKEEQDNQILYLREECDSKTKQLSIVELELTKVKTELQAKSDALAHSHKAVKRDDAESHLLNRQLSSIKSTLVNPDKRRQAESKTSASAAHDSTLHQASSMTTANGRSSFVPQSPAGQANAPVNGSVITTEVNSPGTTDSIGGDRKHGQDEGPLDGTSTSAVISTNILTPVVTSPVVAAHDITASGRDPSSGGPKTFFELQRKQRQENARIIDRGSGPSFNGVVAQPPTSMQVVTRTPVATSEAPTQAASFPAAVGRDFASQSPDRTLSQYPALIPTRAPAPAQARAPAQAPAATPAVAPAQGPIQTSSAPTAAVGPHAGPAAMAALQRKYERLERSHEYIKRQLSDARTGPGAMMNTRAPPSGSNHKDQLRVTKLLAAIKEANCEHRCCSDCSINFMSQFRGITEDPNNPNLIMKCLKCEAEVFRWDI